MQQLQSFVKFVDSFDRASILLLRCSIQFVILSMNEELSFIEFKLNNFTYLWCWENVSLLFGKILFQCLLLHFCCRGYNQMISRFLFLLLGCFFDMSIHRCVLFLLRLYCTLLGTI